VLCRKAGEAWVAAVGHVVASWAGLAVDNATWWQLVACACRSVAWTAAALAMCFVTTFEARRKQPCRAPVVAPTGAPADDSDNEGAAAAADALQPRCEGR
jgi:hypothetical protein